jgi:hypothetical protein
MFRLICIFVLCLAPALSHAQMTSEKIAEDVVKTMAKPKPMVAAMNVKTFQSGGNMGIRPATISESSFKYESKGLTSTFKTSRSFLGIKNPWIGKSVYNSKSAPVWAKSLVENSGKTFATNGDLQVKGFTDSKKAAFAPNNAAATKTSAASTAGTAQGAILNERAKKEMSIEEVRELLNKNR